MKVSLQAPGEVICCKICCCTQDLSSDVAYFLQKGDELRREGSYQEAIEVQWDRWWPGKLTVCYWKLSFLLDLPIKNGDFPSFFVCLPEGCPIFGSNCFQPKMEMGHQPSPKTYFGVTRFLVEVWCRTSESILGTNFPRSALVNDTWQVGFTCHKATLDIWGRFLSIRFWSKVGFYWPGKTFCSAFPDFPRSETHETHSKRISNNLDVHPRNGKRLIDD